MKNKKLFLTENVEALRALSKAVNEQIKAQKSAIEKPVAAASGSKYNIKGFVTQFLEEDFSYFLAQNSGDIEVRINSPGGVAYVGMSIANELEAYAADGNKVVTVVDGIAASAASVIFQAGTDRVMNLGTRVMIHDAIMLAWGNAEMMREAAEILEALSDDFAEIYAYRGSKSPAEFRKLMKKETFFTAKQAIEYGLADRISGKENKGADSSLSTVVSSLVANVQRQKTLLGQCI